MFKPAGGGLGLSINTASANSGATQPAQTGGLFGSSTTQQQPQQSGGLFGGQNQQQAQQPQQGGGLFGGAQAKPAGGLFGSTPAQPQSGGLFGGGQQTQQPQSGGLFGGGQQQQQPQSGGLFGGGQQQQQQQPQQQSGGLFGGGQQQQPQQQSGGLFGGGQQQQPQQQSGGLFGGGLTMGQSTNQQTVPGVRIDLANVKGTTKFSDLTPELQKQVEQCDNIIQTFKGHADQIAQFRAGHTGDLERLTHDVNWLQRKFDGVKTTLEDDVKVVANLKDLIKSDADIAKAAFKGAEQLKLPAHYHTTWLTASKPAEKTPERDEGDPDLEDCITLFSKEAGRLDELHRFQVQKIREMEQHMPGVENGLYERMRALRDGAPQFPAFGYAVELLDVTKALGDEIVRAAGVIIETREKLTEIQLRPMPSRK
ncbi:hypothetical protein F5X68DRAFT_223285 [Plectosphaerella plurivora]|uniref:Uncharacterized protein n=1 Tax=Plectosphaerella plurivora TaxID=936078 RepID=A0A9P8V9E2_9PEZI|nr:hypothetical protein F5X68DRAFT_223285 [Plectosphaerella plurivora]